MNVVPYPVNLSFPIVGFRANSSGVHRIERATVLSELVVLLRHHSLQAVMDSGVTTVSRPISHRLQLLADGIADATVIVGAWVYKVPPDDVLMPLYDRSILQDDVVRCGAQKIVQCSYLYCVSASLHRKIHDNM